MEKRKLRLIKRKLIAVFLVFMLLCLHIFDGAGNMYVKAAEELPDWAKQLGYNSFTASYDETSDTLSIKSIYLSISEPEKQQPISANISCSGGAVISVEWYLGNEKVEIGTIAGYNKTYTAVVQLAPPSSVSEHKVCYADSVVYTFGNYKNKSSSRNGDGSLTVTQSFTTGKGSVINGSSGAVVTYDGNPIDISALGMFTFDKNAGPVIGYEIIDKNYQGEPTTGTGYITGSVLTVTKTGRFVIQVRTEETEEYVSGRAISTLIVNDAENVKTSPEPSQTESPMETASPVMTGTPEETVNPTNVPKETLTPTSMPQYSYMPYEPAISGQISIDDNKWETFCEKFDFNILLKDKARVSIIPTDDVSNVVQIKYYVSDKVLSKNDLNKLDEDLWEKYEDTFYIEKTGKNVVYARLSDSIGNNNYISSNGITLYKDAVQKTNSITYTKLSDSDCKIELELNGNAVKKLDNGSEAVTREESYTVSDDGTLVLKKHYLDGLDAGQYEFRVSYQLSDYEYEYDDENLLSDTLFKVNIKNAEIDNGSDDNNSNGDSNDKDDSDSNEKQDDNNNSDASNNNDTPKFDIRKNAIKLNAGFKVSQVKDKIIVSWGRVEGSAGYFVYVQCCGRKYTDKSKNIVQNGKKVKIEIKKVNGKKLNLKKNYKVYVSAYTLKDGKKYDIGKTITAHVVGRKNKKWTNVKKVKAAKSSYKLKVGRTAQIRAKTVMVDEKKKPLSDRHATKFRYASDDKEVATVSKKGKITAKKNGMCKIYVYSRNGYAKMINITVNK